jgi:hypothetical protein
LPHARPIAMHIGELHPWRPDCCFVCCITANGSCEHYRRHLHFIMAIRVHQRPSAYL